MQILHTLLGWTRSTLLGRTCPIWMSEKLRIFSCAFTNPATLIRARSHAPHLSIGTRALVSMECADAQTIRVVDADGAAHASGSKPLDSLILKEGSISFSVIFTFKFFHVKK